MKYSFPAVFEVDKEDKNFINVSFPDILGAVTFGVGKEDAIVMAKDALKSLLEYDYVKNITPTSLEQTKQNFKNEDVEIELIEVEI